ncbi:hypothetical protein Tco_1384876 [Tanacetum coccineum]
MFNGGVDMVSLYIRCSTEESICYRCTLDVQRRSQYAIVVHYMFNGGVDMPSLYIRCSTEESICYRCTLDVQRTSRCTKTGDGDSGAGDGDGGYAFWSHGKGFCSHGGQVNDGGIAKLGEGESDGDGDGLGGK